MKFDRQKIFTKLLIKLYEPFEIFYFIVNAQKNFKWEKDERNEWFFLHFYLMNANNNTAELKTVPAKVVKKEVKNEEKAEKKDAKDMELSQSKDEEEDFSEFPRSPKINGEDEEEALKTLINAIESGLGE